MSHKAKTKGSVEPQTEAERLLYFRSQVEGSVAALMRTRQQLENLMPVEGNSELKSLLLMGSADLQTELKRHKELTSYIGSCVHAELMHDGRLKGPSQTGSSHEFLKEILRG